MHASEQTCALKTFSEQYKANKLTREEKTTSIIFFVAQVRVFFFFFIFNHTVLFSFCTQIFLFTRCEVAENDNYRQ